MTCKGTLKVSRPTGEAAPGPPYWTHDASLFTGTFLHFGDEPVLVRGKFHLAAEPYTKRDADLEIVPLTVKRGTRVCVRPHESLRVGPRHHTDHQLVSAAFAARSHRRGGVI